MLNRILAKTLLTAFAVATLVSCKKDDKDPANVITDANGLKTSISWTSTATSPSNIDLDIYLYQGTGSNKTSTNYYSNSSTGSSETFTLPNTLADGDYTVTVDYFDVPAAGKINFSFAGNSANGATYSINDVNFTTTQDGTEPDVIKINKSGNKYTVTKL